MDDGPIIVFSDTHFGFEAESARRFQNFVLNWLAPLVYTGSKKITSNEGEKTLEAPSKIILIGDILELLAPRNCDPTLPLRESFDIFNSLVALRREIIYVSGNHDEEIGSYECNYAFENGCQLTIYPDHYPVHESGKLGQKIGAKTYLFFHGHQFDRVWGPRFWRKFGDFIAQSSAGIRHWKLFNVSGLIILSVTIGLWLLLPLGIDWLSWLGGTLAAKTLLSPLALIGPFVWGFFLFLTIVWLFSRATQWYYHTTCPGYPRVARDFLTGVVELSARANFRKVMDTINADVVVFGHTHVPEKCYDVEGTKKQLVNSGSWITYEDRKSDCGLVDRVRLWTRRSTLRKRHQANLHDTFVYIDRDGPLLLRWDDDKNQVRELRTKERCLEH